MRLRLVLAYLAAHILTAPPCLADVPDHVDPTQMVSSAESEFLSRIERAEASFDPSCERFLALADQASRRRLKTYPDLTGEAARARFAIQQPDLMLFAIQTSLADALRTSRELSRRLISSTDDPATQFYDVIFTGAGSAELTAQLTLRKISDRPLKTLTIESDEAVARTFWSTRAFYLNSTDGTPGAEDRPLPNQGVNLNNIPGGFVQTSNVRGSGKYSTAGVLGDILNVNRFLLSAPILFGERVVSYRPTSDSRRRLGYPRLTVTLASGRELFANYVFLGTGLGGERSSASSPAGRAFVESEWDEYVNTGRTPRYFTSLRFFNFITHARRPYIPFVDKEVLVVGDGDFAKVGWEFLERQGPPECYRDDTPFFGRSAPGRWLAQGIVPSCDAFINQSRGRYLLAIPAALQKGRITTINGRSLDVTPMPGGRVRTTVLGADGKVSSIVSDVVVDFIGFKADRLIDAPTTDVIADLPVTGPAVVGRQTYPGAYIFGAASGVPVTDKELAGNQENSASLFLNLVRVQATVEHALAGYRPDAGFTPLPARPRQRIDVAPTRSFVRIDLVNPDGYVQDRDFAREFANAQIEASVRDLRIPAHAHLDVEIYGRRVDGVSSFDVTGLLNGTPLAAGVVKRLAESLTATPAFASVLDEQLDGGPMTFAWSIRARGEDLHLTYDAHAGAADVEPIERRLLKGFRPPSPLSYQAMSPLVVAPPDYAELARRYTNDRLPRAQVVGTSPGPSDDVVKQVVVPFPDRPWRWLLTFGFRDDQIVAPKLANILSSGEVRVVKDMVNAKLGGNDAVKRVSWDDYGWLAVTITERRFKVRLLEDGLFEITEPGVSNEATLSPLKDGRGPKKRESKKSAPADVEFQNSTAAVGDYTRTRLSEYEVKRTIVGSDSNVVDQTIKPFRDAGWLWSLKYSLKDEVVTKVVRLDEMSTVERLRVTEAVVEQIGGGLKIDQLTWDDFGWVARAQDDRRFRVTRRTDRRYVVTKMDRFTGLAEIASAYTRIRLPESETVGGFSSNGPGEIDQFIKPFPDLRWQWRVRYRIEDQRVASVEFIYGSSSEQELVVANAVAAKIGTLDPVTDVAWDDFGWAVTLKSRRRLRVTRSPDRTYQITEDGLVVRNGATPDITKVFANALSAQIPGATVNSVISAGVANVVVATIRPRRDLEQTFKVAAMIQGTNIRWVVRLDQIGAEEFDEVKRALTRETDAGDLIEYLTLRNLKWIARKKSGDTFRVRYVPGGLAVDKFERRKYPDTLGQDANVELANTFVIGKIAAGGATVRKVALDGVTNSTTASEVQVRVTVDQANGDARERVYMVKIVDRQPVELTEIDAGTIDGRVR